MEKTYVLRDEGSGVEHGVNAASLDEAREEAADWARDGDWNLGDGDQTIWVRVQILDDDRDVLDVVKVAIDPSAPKCVDGTRGGHDWRSPFEIVGGLRENPGVHGHGGGVVIREVCLRCGTLRVTDTWAQDRATGEQGLESVRYEARRFAAEVAEMAEMEEVS